MGRFTNPADYMIKLSQEPSSCKKGMTHIDLIEAYESNGRPQIEEGMNKRTERYRQIDTNFMDFAENRKSSACTQFWGVFGRNMQFIVRNKKAFSGIFSNAIMIGIIMVSVFWGVAYPTALIDFYKTNTPDTDPAKLGEQASELS